MGISGGGHGNSLQYSCLKNLMDRGAWRAIVHGVAKESDTTQWLNNSSNFTTILKEQQQDGQFQQKSHHQWIQWRRQQLYLSFEPRSLEESNQFHLLDLTWNKNMVKNKRKCPCFHYKKKKDGHLHWFRQSTWQDPTLTHNKNTQKTILSSYLKSVKGSYIKKINKLKKQKNQPTANILNGEKFPKIGNKTKGTHFYHCYLQCTGSSSQSN